MVTMAQSSCLCQPRVQCWQRWSCCKGGSLCEFLVRTTCHYYHPLSCLVSLHLASHVSLSHAVGSEILSLVGSRLNLFHWHFAAVHIVSLCCLRLCLACWLSDVMPVWVTVPTHYTVLSPLFYWTRHYLFCSVLVRQSEREKQKHVLGRVVHVLQ